MSDVSQDSTEGTTPQYQQKLKQAKEEKARKKNKATDQNVSVEMVASTSAQRIKYRRVTRLSNGNVHREPISKEDFNKHQARA